MTKEVEMPTSDSEAKKIQEIMDDFLTAQEAKEITKRLDEEVGKHTDNDSLKVSLEMLRKLYEISS
tara:strand:+ start:411 stop:608 length:198 start_codon:yes stop_codon:yes gene_type:complete